MHDLGVVHGNLESASCQTPIFSTHHTLTLTFFQTNVLVDSDGTPRIAGLGSALIQSSGPVALSEGSFELTRCSAPELVNPDAFGLPGPQTTKASDMYAFGVLAYEVKHLPTPIPTH